MRIEVLGPVQLRDDGGDVLEVPERKVRALLAALTAAGGETVSADALIDRVWGEDLPGSPSRVLQAKLSQLRSLLDTASEGARELLVRSPGGYSLAAAANCDAAEFREAVRTTASLPLGRERAELLESVLGFWRGPAYAEFSDELWCAAEAAGLQEDRLLAVELCAEALVAAGAPEWAVSLASPWFAENPTREGLAAPLLLGSYRSRRQPEALAVYERLRGHLAEEFGVDPSLELQELHLSILRQDPELESVQASSSNHEQTAAPADSVPGGRLPAYPSPFLGRAEEIQQVSGLLAEHRLVTLLGIGGIGKTRLAVRTAQEVIAQAPSQTPSQAQFVDLTEAHECSEGEGRDLPDRVARLIVAALKLSSPWQDGADQISRVAAAVEGRDALLVLDNCEHVIDEVAGFVDRLLRRAPRVRILITSREPVGLPDEHRYVVPQLPIDGGSGSAVEFFLARARAVNPAVDTDPSAAQAAAELCRRLDGLPLALELAAARTSVLSVPELVERVTDRLDLLARPDRAAPRRQQTLRGMLDWSWSLLEEEGRVLLRRLAVHPVTWRLDVIEQVCADSERSPALSDADCPATEGPVIAARGHALLPRGRVFPVLAGLVERSLVSTVNVGGELRYRLLETVGAYATEKLGESGEREAVARRHLSYHRNLADCAHQYLFGPHAPDWVRRLDDARPHLSLAMEEALRTKDGADAVSLALSMFWYRWMTGRLEALIDELTAVAAGPEPVESPEMRRAHAQVVVLAATVEDRRPGDKVDQVLAALERFDPDEQSQLARMQVQWFASTVMYADAEHRECGRRLADESLGYLLESGDVRAAAFGSTQRDWFLLAFWEEPPQGMPDGSDVEQILWSHGDVYGLTQALGVQHLWAEAQGRREESCRLAEEVLALGAELNLEGEMAYWELVHAALRLREGRLDDAEAHLGRGHRLAQRVAFVYCFPLHDALAAMLAQRRGEDQRLQQLFGRMSSRDRASAGQALRRYFSEDALPAELQSSGRRRVSSTTAPASSSEVRAKAP